MKPNSTLSELKMFMLSLGFDYYGGKYYQCFKKEEGNCELTVSGAEDLQKLFQRKQFEARLDELSRITKPYDIIRSRHPMQYSEGINPDRYVDERIAKLTKELKEK